MSKIEQIIGEIEEYIENCKSAPLSNSKIIVNKDEMYGLLLELREQIPSEVKQYQKIISNQDAILSDAKTRANSMVAEANRMTEQLVDEHEIMQKAYATANKLIDDANVQAQIIIDNATNDANGIRTASIRYTDDMLKSLQSIIVHSMEESQTRFDQFISSMQSSYDIVNQNRNELSGSITEIQEDNSHE